MSAKFLAEQLAGSCQIEGIHVTKEQLAIMQDVISGKSDATELRSQLVERYRQKSHS